MAKRIEREYRDMKLAAVENEENESLKVNGYASTFNQPYTLYEDNLLTYREQVDPEAFADTEMSDVIMQYDPEGRVFARISNGTLRVQPDEEGLYIEADLGGTELGRQLYDEIRGGYTDKMSFGFIVSDDVETRTENEDGRVDILRTITGVSKLFDVSAVSIPANGGTSIGVATRKRIDGAIEEIQTERSVAEALRIEKLRAEVKARALARGNTND